MAEYEESINVRRDKLRDLILKEEMELTREIIEQAQHGNDFRMEEMREETERLRRQQEEERLALLATKRMQQYIERHSELRTQLTKRFTKEAKSCNLVQMAENEAKRRAENELEELWHELMLREIKAKEDREIEEAKKRFHQQQDALTTLAKQVAGKLALEEEEKRVRKEEREYLEQLWENVRKEETKKLETERKKREALKKELEEQASRAKRILIERAKEEAKIDETLNDLAKEELEREKQAVKESSIALRQELLAYLKYLEELREEEAKRNLEVDKIIEESMKDANARRDLAVKRFKEMRERNLREVLLGREEQLRLKKESMEREKRSIENEKILLEKEIETNAKLSAIMKEEERKKMICYGKDLKEQQKYYEIVRAREREEDEKIYQDGLKREEEYQKLNEVLLKATENIARPHPFNLLLKEYETRHRCQLVLEKPEEVLSYCPPSLPPPIQTLPPSSTK
ncbi:PREDICTED: trichoplein keratin filament-binding protein-like [Polistes dominula]|uniref:Trichoplein keratin filament-binding protein-like n=1 Tax=Polistes dominula TaxID=743375 RepID=A0ABM1HYJ1_POLDO|nr:PREDICTED: trichoplein keratin filament-binding protein-like [Polistes dominula]